MAMCNRLVCDLQKVLCEYQSRLTQVPGIYIRTNINMNHQYQLGDPNALKLNRGLQIVFMVSLGLISSSFKTEQALEEIHNHICEIDCQEQLIQHNDIT